MQTPRQPRQSLIPTPGRPLQPQSNLPTPTASSRRRVSTGLDNSISSQRDDDERTAAFKEAMRVNPPPSSLRTSTIGLTSDESPENVTGDHEVHPLSYSVPSAGPDSSRGVATPGNPSSRRYQNLGISHAGTPASRRQSSAQPRTPSAMQLRSRTTSNRLAQPATTPSRIVSGSLRPSTLQAMNQSTSAVTPKRRPSNLGTSSARTPIRPESRQSELPRTPGQSQAEADKDTEIQPDWHPEVGTAVRIGSMGFEGIVRYIGPVEGKVGKYAGVELDRGFIGKGKNDGTYGGKTYFYCPPLGGVFALYEKLSPPEERPASVASFHSGMSASTSSIIGRATPALSIQSGRDTPFISENDEQGDEMNASSSRTVVGRSAGPLTRSTRANVPASSTKPAPQTPVYKVGGRASALSKTNAKQLAAQKALAATDGSLADLPARAATPTTPGAPPGRSMLAASISTSSSGSATTPKPMMKARQSLSGIATPSRTVSMSAQVLKSRARESIGGPGGAGFATPKAGMSLRSGRMSSASGRASVSSNPYEAMPPPPSPSKAGILGRSTAGPQAAAAALRDAETRAESLKATNQLLLDKIAAFEAENKELKQCLSGEEGPASFMDKQLALESELKEAQRRVQEHQLASDFQVRELNSGKVKIERLEQQLRQFEDNAATTNQEMQETQNRLAKAEGTVAKLTKDLEVEKQRLEEEFEKGMQAKREEVRNAEEAVRDLKKQLSVVEMVKAEIVNDASQMTAIYEAKLIDAKSRRIDLEKMVRSLEDQLLEAQERRNQTALSPSEALKEADTAAMIDNENLKAQVAHQQKKIVSLEDQNEELQVQIEKYDEAAIKANEKARDNERRLKEEIASGRSEIANLREQIEKHKDRVAELTHALKDQGNTLASAQAEIESNRVDLADLETMRVAQTMLNRAQKEKSALQEELELARSQGEEAEHLKVKLAQLQDEFEKLSARHDDLRTKHALALPTGEGSHKRETTASSDISSKLSISSTNTEKSIAGFQKIVADLTDENGDLKQKIQDLEAEVQTLLADNQQLAAECSILRESLAQLEAAVEDKLAKEEEALDASGGDSVKASDISAEKTLLEMDKIKSRLSQVESEKIDIERRFAGLMQEQERELRELESLVEAKIYREDELERQIELLKRENERPGTSLSYNSSNTGANGYHLNPSQARAPSSASTNTSVSARMCPLCEGDHEIEACPMFTNDEVDESPGSTSPSAARGASLARRKSGLRAEQVWCDNCDTKAHRTADCPLADDVF